MIFTMGYDTLTIITSASYPYGKGTKLIQVKDTSASGVVHVESFSVETNTLVFKYNDLPQSEYEGLLNWFVDIAQGMLKTFNVVDDLGVNYENCRFTSQNLSFNLTSHLLWEGKFTLEITV